MTEFRGFRCNGCGTIITGEDKVKERVVFIGPDGDEESYFRDLCKQKCAPERQAEVRGTHTPTPTRQRRNRDAAAMVAAAV